MCIKNLVLCSAIILGTASAASAAGPNGSAELQRCIANLQASGYGFGGDPDTTGMTAYDVMVGRCTDQIWRRHAR